MVVLNEIMLEEGGMGVVRGGEGVVKGWSGYGQWWPGMVVRSVLSR